MKNYLIVGFVFYFVFGCKPEIKKTNDDDIVLAVDTLLVLRNEITLKKIRKDINERLEGVTSFPVFVENIDSLKVHSSKKLVSTLKSINDDSVDLYKNFPKNLKENTILSRLNQVRTYTQLARYQLSKRKKNYQLIDSTISKILKSYNTFVEQLNDIDSGITEDFEKELQKENYVKDSLKQVEKPLF